MREATAPTPTKASGLFFYHGPKSSYRRWTHQPATADLKTWRQTIRPHTILVAGTRHALPPTLSVTKLIVSAMAQSTVRLPIDYRAVIRVPGFTVRSVWVPAAGTTENCAPHAPRELGVAIRKAIVTIIVRCATQRSTTVLTPRLRCFTVLNTDRQNTFSFV